VLSVADGTVTITTREGSVLIAPYNDHTLPFSAAPG
jgi:hypothetical protein